MDFLSAAGDPGAANRPHVLHVPVGVPVEHRLETFEGALGAAKARVTELLKRWFGWRNVNHDTAVPNKTHGAIVIERRDSEDIAVGQGASVSGSSDRRTTPVVGWSRS